MSRLCSLFRPRTRAGWRLGLLLALIALAALALAGVIDPLQSGVLTMLPALALAVIMLTRPYPGERAIAQLRRRHRRRWPKARPTPAPTRPATRVVRGGCLIAAPIAGRAPPLALAGC